MENMNITLLGTSSAIPTEKRNHTAILVRFADENILVDCGEGTQRQFKIAKLNPCKLTRVLITHWHGDHVLGLPGLLETLALSNYQKTLKIYGPRGTKRFISLIQELIIDFHINIEVHEVASGKIVDEKSFLIEASDMIHGPASLAYSISLKEKIRLRKDKIKSLKLPNLPILAELQQGKDIVYKNKRIKSKEVTYAEKGKKVTIILDTAQNKNTILLAENSDILIADSSFSSEELDKANEYRHLTSVQAAEIAKKSNSKKLILTHISQRYEHNPQKIEKEAKKVFKNSKVGKDFDSFEI